MTVVEGVIHFLLLYIEKNTSQLVLVNQWPAKWQHAPVAASCLWHDNRIAPSPLGWVWKSERTNSVSLPFSLSSLPPIGTPVLRCPDPTYFYVYVTWSVRDGNQTWHKNTTSGMSSHITSTSPLHLTSWLVSKPSRSYSRPFITIFNGHLLVQARFKT